MDPDDLKWKVCPGIAGVTRKKRCRRVPCVELSAAHFSLITHPAVSPRCFWRILPLSLLISLNGLKKLKTRFKKGLDDGISVIPKQCCSLYHGKQLHDGEPRHWKLRHAVISCCSNAPQAEDAFAIWHICWVADTQTRQPLQPTQWKILSNPDHTKMSLVEFFWGQGVCTNTSTRIRSLVE